MKMLDSAAFYTPLGNSRPYSWYTFDIRVTFQVHSKCILGIPAAFCLNSWMFEPHSAAIPWAFWLHSNSSRDTFLQALFGQQSNWSYGIRLAFWTFWQHSKYSYWVPTTFELHSRANTLVVCKNHSMWVRGEFWVFERHSNDDPTRMWLEFWKCFIPADSGSFRFRVTGALHTYIN